MKTFRCRSCKEDLDCELRLKGKGKGNICRKCYAAHCRRYYNLNREKVLERNRKSNEKHREARRLYAREYHKKNKDKRAKAAKRYKELNPQKVSCKLLAQSAIIGGKIKRQPCENCGISPTEVTIHAHHEDYNKPYDVVWLCPKCHNRLHGKRRYL